VPGATIFSAPSTDSPAHTANSWVESSIAQFHKSIQKIVVKGWNDLLDLTWAADGKALYVVAGIRAAHVLLHVNLQGNARILWRSPGASGETLAYPSPDGRHLAIQNWVANGNMWMMENF